ncbi:MAG: NAD(P)H-hydrate dehydratase [Anaerolineaceae bacterium]
MMEATPITYQLAASILPQRPNDSHKGTFGKALIIAGSKQFPGAANLAIQAALRSGVGLVYAAIPESIYIPLSASIPEAIWFILPEESGAISLKEPLHRAGSASSYFTYILKRIDAVLIGPGLGQAEGAQAFLLALLRYLHEQASDLPLVVDADALNLLSQQPNWPSLLSHKVILTPHEMEFSRLTGLPVEEIHTNRQVLAADYAQQWGQTFILKGANTLVASPEGKLHILPFANSALAHGGTGDVLAGLLVGLLAQRLTPYDAAMLAVWLHARAAELALEAVGHPAAVLPSDIIQKLGRATKDAAGFFTWK